MALSTTVTRKKFFPDIPSQATLDQDEKIRNLSWFKRILPFDVFIYRDAGSSRLNYDAFNQSCPYQGQRVHQLCFLDLVIEWGTYISNR